MDSPSSSVPRLCVPNIIAEDKTPTPTKLLQAVDEIGLFQEDEDREDKVNQLKSRLTENPFDEHFRKATQMQKDGINHSAEKSKEDEVLNTPQILTSEYPTPSVVISSESSILKSGPVSRSNSLLTSARSLRPLPPSTHSSQLPVHWSAATVSLTPSVLPKNGGEFSPEIVRENRKRKKSCSEILDSQKRQELLERNRAAAVRSRAKKRLQVQTIQRENANLVSANKDLMSENQELKIELQKLQELLTQYRDCFGPLPAQPAAGGPKIHSDVNIQSAPSVRIISVDPKDILRGYCTQVESQHSATKNAFLSSPWEILPSTSGDILREAVQQVVGDQHVNPLVKFQNGGSVSKTPPKNKIPIVLGNPGFVRVTPKSITVRNNFASKGKKK